MTVASIVNFAKRIVKYDNKVGIHLNGVDNAYPERMDRLINNSPTAKMSAKLMTQFVMGQGVENANEFVVDKEEGTTLLDFCESVASSLVKHRGVFIHVSYNLSYEVARAKVLPFAKCRVGRSDDDNYVGKILINDEWEAKKVDKKSIKAYDVYNPNKVVIKSQIEASKGESLIDKIENYRGQILYINLDSDYLYPYSTIDAVQHDCDSEYQSGLFTNTSLTKGFFGKNILLVPSDITADPNDTTDEGQRIYHEQLNEAEEFKNTLEEFCGAGHSGGALVVQSDITDDDNLDKLFKHIKIDSDINDKMFEYTDRRTFLNITSQFNNIPSALLRSNDAALFGNSGEVLREAEKQYQKNTSRERQKLEQIVKKVMQRFSDFELEIKIKPLIDVNKQIGLQETPETGK